MRDLERYLKVENYFKMDTLALIFVLCLSTIVASHIRHSYQEMPLKASCASLHHSVLKEQFSHANMIIECVNPLKPRVSKIVDHLENGFFHNKFCQFCDVAKLQTMLYIYIYIYTLIYIYIH